MGAGPTNHTKILAAIIPATEIRGMTQTFRALTAACLLGFSVQAQDSRLEAAHSWGQWRGPLSTGEAPLADPPTRWSEKENIRWKAELPGRGYGTPIVWKNQVFITAAIPFGETVEAVPDNAPGAHDNAPVTKKQEYVILAYDRATGNETWRRSLRKELPHAGAHNSGTLASASPVADGEHVFAFFGSQGLYCLDHQGKLVWEKDLGNMNVKHGHGEGSSPVLHGDTIVVNWDHEDESFVVAFDKATGEERWRKKRDEGTSWSTPIAIEHEGKVQVIVSGTTRVRAYDQKTGDVIWECGGLSHNVVASPVAAGGIVVLGSSYEKRRMFAVRLNGAKGDVTKTDKVIWRHARRTPYVPSPLLYRGHVYFLNHYQGVLSRLGVETGKEATGPFRLGGLFNIYASPVAASGRLYVTDREGVTLVLTADKEPRFLARNELDDNISASLAIVDKEIFLRGDRFLYCVAETTKKKSAKKKTTPLKR